MGRKGGIFSYTDQVDKLFMMLGALGSIGDGLMSLLTMLALSLTISDYGADYTSLPSQLVDKVTLSRPESVSMVILPVRFSHSEFLVPVQHALRLLIIAIIVGISAFIGKFSDLIFSPSSTRLYFKACEA